MGKFKCFKCWANDDSEEFAGTIEAIDAETAAEIYAEKVFRGGDTFEELEVHVKSESGEAKTFTVDAEYDVSFYASEAPAPPAKETT